MNVYRSIVVRMDPSKEIIRESVLSNISDLPENDVLIEVKYTALNYHDAVIMTGKKPHQTYPIVPGTDVAGVVVSSKVPDFQVGDEVVATGFDLGSKIPGGFGKYISAPADWIFHIPIGMSFREVVTLGSAGIAACLGGTDLINTGVVPENNTIAVTGASFDFGAIATSIFTMLGYNVIAYVESDNGNEEYLKKLGVKNIKPMEELRSMPEEVDNPIFDGAYDTHGSVVLSSILKLMRQNSTVVLAGSIENTSFEASVFPFLDRGVNIIGANAIHCSSKVKQRVWQKLASDWRLSNIDWLSTEISMDEVESYLPLVINRLVKGRIVINHAL